jgi:hypothetical protein
MLVSDIHKEKMYRRSRSTLPAATYPGFELRRALKRRGYSTLNYGHWIAPGPSARFSDLIFKPI